jgi:PAS domain S-box-containing protein
LLPELFLKRKISDVMPPEFAVRSMHYVTLALETGETQVYEYELPLHGSPRRYQARVTVSGRDEVLALVRDITERKKDEEPRR